MKRIILLLYTVLCTLYSFGELKYVFYVIGDGMGTNQILAAEMYRAALNGDPYGRVQTRMSAFPYMGYISTHSANSGVTDSSAAGTTLATGVKTNNGTIGLDAHGDTLTTIAEELKAQGWGVALLTSVAIDHATPAAFYGHVKDRHYYYEIGQQLCASNFDFFGGAGFHQPQGKHNDQKNLFRLTEQAGYTIAHGMEEAVRIQNSDVSKMILIQAGDDQETEGEPSTNFPYAIDRKPGDLTLPQVASVAIPFMAERHDRFFMMIEGGMIDYAGHGDDAATSIGEVWDMDEALQQVYEFYLAHPDETLIVVTSDHETGGMGLGIGGKYVLHLDVLQHQKCSAWILSDIFSDLFKNNTKPSWAQVKQIYREQLGFWDTVKIKAEEERELKELYEKACKGKAKNDENLYKSVNALGKKGITLINKKARVGWTSSGHTAHAVPVFAIGVNAELFTGWKDNTDLVPTIRKAINE